MIRYRDLLPYVTVNGRVRVLAAFARRVNLSCCVPVCLPMKEVSEGIESADDIKCQPIASNANADIHENKSQAARRRRLLRGALVPLLIKWPRISTGGRLV